MNKSRKVCIIGTGFVGSTIAFTLTLKGLADEVILIDINKDKAKGEALDISHGIASMGLANIRAGDYPDCRDSNLIIMTAGRNRRTGETRLQMLEDNIKIVEQVCSALLPYYNSGTILVVTNPVDILTAKITEFMGLSDGRVFGTGCILDTSRLIKNVSTYCNVDSSAVEGYVVGEHGEGQIIPWDSVKIKGDLIEQYCLKMGISWNEQIRSELEIKVKEAGMQVIEKKGQTQYEIAVCVGCIAKAVLENTSHVLPVSSVLTDVPGMGKVALSLPSAVGETGIAFKAKQNWSDGEIAAFKQSCNKLQNILLEL